MKKFTAFFMAMAILLSIVSALPATAATDSSLLCSGYYGINRTDGVIGQVVPGTEEALLFSRVLADGALALTNGVKTGSELTLSREGVVVDKLSLVVQADCSGDGQFSITDMLMVKSMLLGQQTFTAAQSHAADVSGDASVTITDFLQMKRSILGLASFSPKYVSGAAAVRSQILAVGDTYPFGPSGEVPPETVPPETTPETVPPETTPETVPPETTPETVPPETTPETVPPETTPETVPPETIPEIAPPETTPEAVPAPAAETPAEETLPPESVTVEGDAVTWADGVITAVKLGTARLSYGDETLIVTVCEEALQISLPDTTLFIGPGGSTTLLPVLNHPADKSLISYSVSDSNVLQVTQEGQLTALAQGSATVTATLPNGASASQNVTVIQLIESLSLEKDYIKLKPGMQKPIVTTRIPAQSPEKLIWTSSDTDIATVDENGIVTGVKYGTVTVTGISEYGKVSVVCKVKVCDLIQVALTYDDGPSSVYTPKVLDMLKEHDIKVTFFMVGNRIKTSPTSVKRMADEGHELGYHTWEHTFFFNMSAKEIAADFEQFQQAVYNASGKYATVYRAPGGNITDNALKTIPLPHIMWSVDTRDWATRNTEAVKNAVLNGLKDGAIILVHDIHATTYYGTKEAIEYIIKKDLDVEFLTVTELLSRKGQTPEAGKTYYKN